ncbi:MAG: hypothetical protein J5767_15225 [Paludibacteraceae bacterium]|nr:hypothetical protein [Paludibacteraceae bacterium]
MNKLFFIALVLLLVGCDSRPKNTISNQEQETQEFAAEEARKQKINDSLLLVEMPLAYKEFVLGDSYSKCLKLVKKHNSMREQWDNTNDRYEYVSELLGVDVFVTVEEFQDTIYEVKLNSSKWSDYRLDTLYKSKYGPTGFDDEPAAVNKAGWGSQRDTRWEFKNGIVEINKIYSDGRFRGGYVVYTDKRILNKKIVQEQEERNKHEAARKEQERKAKEEALKRQSEYKDEI